MAKKSLFFGNWTFRLKLNPLIYQRMNYKKRIKLCNTIRRYGVKCVLYLVEAFAADNLLTHLALSPTAEQAEPSLHTQETHLKI